MSARRALVTLVVALFAAAPSPAQPASPRTLLVHLPSAPVTAAGDQAAAIEAFVEYLSARLPGPALEPKIFRRWRDARDHLDAHAEEVALLLADASFTAGGASGVTPTFRFQRGGKATYRRLLVVRGDRPELEKLVDLQGKTLAVVEASGADVEFVRNQVFDDVLDPANWFAVELESDDFTATASVLYGKTDAALVADFNPLLEENLDRELRAVYESPELSLPLLSVREDAFSAADRVTLGRALEGLPEDPVGRRVLARLGIEGLDRVSAAALAGELGRPAKALVIASPGATRVPLAAPGLPAPEQVAFAVAVELPEIPLGLDEDGPK